MPGCPVTLLFEITGAHAQGGAKIFQKEASGSLASEPFEIEERHDSDSVERHHIDAAAANADDGLLVEDSFPVYGPDKLGYL